MARVNNPKANFFRVLERITEFLKSKNEIKDPQNSKGLRIKKDLWITKKIYVT